MFPGMLDIICFIVIGICIVLGFFRGLAKSIWRSALMIISIIVIFYVFTPLLANYINKDVFKTFNFIFDIRVTLPDGSEIVQKVYSVEDMFVKLISGVQLVDPYTINFAKEVSLCICRAVSFAVLLVIGSIITTFYGAILFVGIDPAFKAIKVKPNKKKYRWAGLIFGAVQGIAYVMLYMNSASALGPGLTYVTNNSEYIVSIFDPEILKPYLFLDSQTSYCFGWAGFGGEMFNFTAKAKGSSTGEQKYYLKDTLVEVVKYVDNPDSYKDFSDVLSTKEVFNPNQLLYGANRYVISL